MAEQLIYFLFPLESHECGWAADVLGWATPAREEVQLLVMAADGKWYPQPHVKRREHYFLGTVYLGWREHPNAKTYRIAAGLGWEWSPEILEELPDSALWTTRSVQRIP
jgi:hypothetical protein